MPDWKNTVQRRISTLRLAPAAEADLVEEIAQDLEDRYRELRSGGTDEQEAYRQVVAELDDLDPMRALLERRHPATRSQAVEAGDARSNNLLEDLWKDLRYAARGMQKDPLFVLFVVLTLGLGIGANTTVFTLINTLILNPLPVRDSSRLAAVAAAESKTASKSSVPLPISYLDLTDYQAQNKVFAALAGYTGPQVTTLRQGQQSERIFAELVSSNYFATLGLTPARGRFFLTGEDSAPGSHPVAVMNYGTWQDRYGGSEDVIGKTLRINNVELTVIGVAPPRFIGVNAIFGPDLWIPAAMAEELLPNEMRGTRTDRNKAIFQGVGRLKPGVSRAQAHANMTAIAASLSRAYPESDEGRTATVRPITDAVFGSAASTSSPILLGGVVLSLVVGIVLLIACSNVANLWLARASARQHEMAVRLAMGASRGRLVRQLLTESVLLGCLSGLFGFSIGYAGLRLVFGALPSAANFISPKLDSTVFVFALIISLATGVLFGAAPAFQASRASVVETLKEEARTMGRSRRRVTLANALLIGQVAFSFLLLVMAGLFLRSIGRAYDIDPGFQTRHLAIAMTNPGQAGYGKAQTVAFYKQARERVAALPGIESVSWASNLPLWSRRVSGLRVEGREQRFRADTVTTVLNTVDVNYFETAGVVIGRGREFTEEDSEDSRPVAIVNEKLAHDYWPNQSALGKRIQLPSEKVMREIVGVAKTGNYTNLAEPPQFCVYVPLAQNYSDAMTLYVRTQGDPQQILLAVQRAVREAGPGILANDIRTGRQIIDNGLFQAKVGVALLSVFGLLALGLASVGLYGIMAYSVSQRTREIGVRMALGAARKTVLGLILRQGMSLVLIGAGIGFAAALLAGRLLSRLLYGVGASDPISVAGALLVLLVAAFLACYMPARAASRLDPLAALREG